MEYDPKMSGTIICRVKIGNSTEETIFSDTKRYHLRWKFDSVCLKIIYLYPLAKVMFVPVIIIFGEHAILPTFEPRILSLGDLLRGKSWKISHVYFPLENSKRSHKLLRLAWGKELWKSMRVAASLCLGKHVFDQ